MAVATEGLVRLGVQADYSAGAFRGIARHLIPPNGVYAAQNVLLDEDGSLYKRGGSAYLSTAAFGSGGLRFLWDDRLAAGRRTVFADASDWAVLDGASAPVNLGGAGTSAPVPPAVMNGIAFLPGGSLYAGSQKAADYSTGTVSVTLGSKTVTGSSTVWSTNADAGMLFQRGAGTRVYPVASVDSNTQITLLDPYEGATASGQTYALTRLYSGAPYRAAAGYVVAGQRLWSLEGRRLYFTAVNAPHTINATTDFHELPEGAEILGGRSFGDAIMVWTTAGIFVIGNVSLDAVDDAGNVQHQVARSSGDLILWDAAGVASWSDAFVCPMIDGIWLVPGNAPPEKLSRSVDELYVSYVRSTGYRPGQAVAYRSHYFLPILDATNVVVDLLVCRLDRQSRPGWWPWTWLRGHGSKVTALAVRVGGQGAAREPRLLGAGSDGRVLDLSAFFEPAAANKADADATVPEWRIEGRDEETGGDVANTVMRFESRYELVDAASDNPTIRAYVATGLDTGAGSRWGVMQWGVSSWSDADVGEWVQLAGAGLESTGRDPYTWQVVKRARHIRFRVDSADPAARMSLRASEYRMRPSGRRAR